MSAADLVRAIAACYDSGDRCAKMATNAVTLFGGRLVADTVDGQMSDFLTQLAESRQRVA